MLVSLTSMSPKALGGRFTNTHIAQLDTVARLVGMFLCYIYETVDLFSVYVWRVCVDAVCVVFMYMGGLINMGCYNRCICC